MAAAVASRLFRASTPEAIEPDLAALWREISATDAPIGRAVMSNLVVFRSRAAALQSLTLHGLRHAFARVANELGYTEATRAALLGHTGSRSQTGDYTHHLDAVLVAAADRVSHFVHSMMTGATAELVQLPTRVA